METYTRICLENYTVRDRAGNTCSVEKGKEYITSKPKNKKVIVFKEFWAPFPLKIFGGEERFT